MKDILWWLCSIFAGVFLIAGQTLRGELLIAGALFIVLPPSRTFFRERLNLPLPIILSVILFAGLIVTGIGVDHAHSDRIQRDHDAKMAAETRQHQIDQFRAKRVQLIAEMRSQLASKDFAGVMLRAEPYLEVSDEEFQSLAKQAQQGRDEQVLEKRKTDYEHNRAEILAKMQTYLKQRQYQAAVDFAGSYLDVADAELKTLNTEAKSQVEKQTREKEQKEKFAEKRGEWIDQGQNLVRRRLKDPDSAQFSFRPAIFLIDDIPVVCGSVNAKNGFGGYNGYENYIAFPTKAIALLPSDTEVEFRTSWKKYCS